ncbi:MAG: hypothetical protein NVSMB32_03680 [Actinomycetota bacterium]
MTMSVPKAGLSTAPDSPAGPPGSEGLGAAPPAPPGGPAPRMVRLGGQQYPLVLPTLRDPRLHLAAIIISLQVLGQTVLGFEVSIAQILVAVLTCGLLEMGLTLWRRRILAWPASALLTGNSVAFILRVPGTVHGDWWSLRGAWLFALAAAISLLSKYVIRRGERHLFNPSNFGLVAVFLIFGSRLVNPQDLWWGPLSPGLVLTLAVIVAGGLAIVRRLHLLGLALAFWVTFSALTGILAAAGHCMSARWHIGPVCGGSFWHVLALSPEILVFMFFMITDPRTSPQGRVARVVFGASVGYVAALLVAPATTEFWTKTGVLGGLAAVCGLRPFLERRLPQCGSAEDRVSCLPRAAGGRGPRRAALSVLLGVGCLGLLIIAGMPARRAGSLPLALSTGPVARPVVQLDPSGIPPVTIDDSVHTIQVTLPPGLAQSMAQDLLADLVIVGDALRTNSEGLAATAATGRELATIQHAIEVASEGGTAMAPPQHSFSALSVVAVKDPVRPQDPARLGIAAKGPGSRTFALTQVGEHYLISIEVGP